MCIVLTIVCSKDKADDSKFSVSGDKLLKDDTN